METPKPKGGTGRGRRERGMGPEPKGNGEEAKGNKERGAMGGSLGIPEAKGG